MKLVSTKDSGLRIDQKLDFSKSGKSEKFAVECKQNGKIYLKCFLFDKNFFSGKMKFLKIGKKVKIAVKGI